MRILRFFFFSLLLIALVGGGVFLAAREILLSIAVSQVKSGVSAMRQMKLTPTFPSERCTNSTLPDVPFGVLQSLQLTFTTEREYQIELICDSELRDPEVTNTFTLPLFVTKKAGTAGLLWGEQVSGITLQLWGREKSVVLDQNTVTVYNGGLPEVAIESPVATCEAYGFTCCASESGLGRGTQTTRVRDCPKSCFAQCVARPVVLSFMSLPFFDVQTRIADAAQGETVTFTYIVEFGAARAGTVTIDYGDGQSDMQTEDTGSFEHAYDCPSGTCQYTVKLTVSDTQAVTSAETNINHIIIRVGNPGR